jgi:hypothetical protein
MQPVACTLNYLTHFRRMPLQIAWQPSMSDDDQCRFGRHLEDSGVIARADWISNLEKTHPICGAISAGVRNKQASVSPPSGHLTAFRDGWIIDSRCVGNRRIH